MTDLRTSQGLRVLVGLDASPASLGALAAAAELAARLGAELAGLFVEDEELLRLAALPFAQVVRATSGARERLDPVSAEAALRAFAARARDALERTASVRRVEYTFRVARGSVVREVLAAADGADLLVLGAGGHARQARAAVGGTARTAAAQARAPVLLIARGSALGEHIAVVDDGTPAAARALAFARRLAIEERPPAVVDARSGGLAPLLDSLVRLGRGLVVLPAGAPLPGGVLERLLALGVPVLVVR